MFRYFVFAFSLFCLLQACQSISKPYKLENHVLNITTNRGKYSIAALTDDVIKVTFSDSLTSGDRLYAPLLTEAQPMQISHSKNNIRAKTAHLTVNISLNPFVISFLDNESGLKLSEEAGYGREQDTTSLRFQLRKDEAIYGTGERAIAMNRRGQRFLSYNNPHYGYGEGALNLNYAIPHIMSSEEYMLLIDNPAKAVWDIGKSEGDVMEFKSKGGNMAYYFINGDSFSELMENYSELTGRQGLLPLWAYGHFQSRFGYRSEQEAREKLQKTLDAGFPVDAIILDIFWFGEEIEDGKMGQLSWDSTHWPDPKGMIADFARKGVKTITVSEPFFTQKSRHYAYLDQHKLLGLDSAGNTYVIEDFYFGPGGLLDIFKPEAQDWMWARYKEQKAYGVAGWWVDLAEPEKHPAGIHHLIGTADEIHGAYGHEWAKMLYEKTAADFPKERLFHLGRAGFAGTHRYGLLPWTGDVSRSWSGLAPQVSMMLSMGLSGLAYLHSDAGGFSMAPGPDAELYTRWLQFATFSPIFRPHADNSVPAEPALWPAEVQAHVKPFVELRYRMLPYNYTLAWENSQTGMPLARPLFTAYPDAPDTLMNEYLWGDELLVAPVLKPGLSEMQLYLPEGKWYDFWTGEVIQGQRFITTSLTMDKIPVYARAGAMIVTTPLVKNTSAYTSEKLDISYYFDVEESATEIYFDDGKTKGAYESGAYQLMELYTYSRDNVLEINCSMRGNGYEGAPATRSASFAVYGLDKAPASVNAGGVAFEWEAEAKVLRFEKELVDGAKLVLRW